MELFKRKDRYDLYDDNGHKVASTSLNTLSKQNCDEIFGVTDVEKLVIEYDLYEKINFVGQMRAYKAGFNKAMELNKDKLFTLEDMQKAFELGHNGAADTYMLEKNEQEFEKLIQQPTEIEVEIEMVFLGFEMESGLKMEEPKLDSNGCLILRKL
jgi:hypothetical protein